MSPLAFPGALVIVCVGSVTADQNTDMHGCWWGRVAIPRYESTCRNGECQLQPFSGMTAQR